MKFAKRAISIVVAIICLIAIIVFLLTDIIRFTDVSSAIAYVLVAGIVGVLIWGFKPQKLEERSPNYTEREVHSKNPTKIKDEPEKQPSKILHKTFKLRVGEYEDKKLNLKRGKKITGKISSDGFFNVYFLTESSYRSFKNDYNFQYLEGAENVSHFELHFDVERSGNYYFVIDHSDKKNSANN